MTSSPLRLLMVEDSEDDAELIRLELSRAGYTLEWRRVDTEPAFLHALDEAWDVILSDFRMPTFDGLRAFRLYQQRAIDTPFIFVSGALGEDRAVEAMRLGARDYLLKGSLARLSVAVKRELAEARNRRATRLAEQTTLREQRRLAMAVEASGAGVFEHTVPPGPDFYCSPRAAEIFGYDSSDLTLQGDLPGWIGRQVHPDDRSVLGRIGADFRAGRRDGYTAELRVQHREGHWVEVAVFARVLERGGDDTLHVVGVVLDLTERRKLEAQLRQAQKMDAVGRLAGGVAHDFNNLLTVIMSFGQFVLEAVADQPTVVDDMNDVLAAAHRAEKLTAQLLAFSRMKPVSPRVLCINSLVSEMDRLLRRLLGEDIDIAGSLAPDLWNVRIDPGSLEQVLVNLAVNARDAMPGGGKLTIETQNVVLDERYGLAHGADIPPGDYVMVAVSDGGEGMDEETQRRIFEPFFTTKEPGRGTGLGLATCYGIVKQAGGFIWVYSEVGGGTTFKIYLPRVFDDADLESLRRPSEHAGGSETVLCVEDDDQVRRLAVRSLEQLGYRVLAAANGTEALRLCEAPGVSIDLLLTDVVMPAMSGKQLVKRLPASLRGLKVLYMSGYTANAIVHRGVLEPNARLLQKPFTPEALALAVRAALDE